jgi:hypothetical protein
MARGKGDIWTVRELDTLRELFSARDWPALLASLPSRNRSAINQKARALRLHRGNYVPWSAAEISALWRLYPMADAGDVEAAIPGRGFVNISKKASALGVKRVTPGVRTNKRYVHPLIRQLVARRQKLTMSRADMARKAGYHVNQLLAWELGKTNPDFRSFREWAEALGLDIVLHERPIMAKASDVVIPWPDRKRMMSRRA